jgi:glutathione S-transferase
MKLRYSAASPYVRKVRVVAIEKGLAGRIETVPTQVSPNKDSTDVAGDNPLMKVPSLTTDDGMSLYDSPVICEYLDSQGSGPTLFPAPGKARWTALRRQALGDGILDAALLSRYETFLRPKEFLWKDWVDGQQRKVKAGLDALEQEADSFGKGVDIGLITIGCALGYLDFRFAADEWRKGHPKLAAWYEGFAARPSMRETVPQG